MLSVRLSQAVAYFPVHIMEEHFMTKTDLIEKLNKENYCTKKDAEALVNAVFDAIREALASGDKVTISKFGTFEVRERSAKECKNPRTGEPVQVAASKAPVFKASKNLKESVNV